MRILVVAEHLGRAGGMERYLDVVLPALVARGATVHVVARAVDAMPGGAGADTIAWADEHDDPSEAAAEQVQRVLDRFAPDVAVAHNVMDAAVLQALHGVRRFVYHVHDHRPFCPNGDRLYPRTARICDEPIGVACARHALTDGCAYGPRPRTLELIERRKRVRDAIDAADAVIVASRYMADVAVRNGIGRERVAEIAPPLPDEAYARADDAFRRVDEPHARHGAALQQVVFVGRVVPQKGLDALVRAMRFIPPQRRPMVRAFGDGPALADALDEAQRRGVRLEAHGPADPAAVRAGIDAATVVAMPSVWGEPFGLVGIEAFARARTVVAYDVGGVRSWLHHGVNGFAVERGNEDALGNMIQVLLDDDAQRAQLARNARRDAERFRLAPAIDALLTAYGG